MLTQRTDFEGAFDGELDGLAVGSTLGEFVGLLVGFVWEYNVNSERLLKNFNYI